MRKHCNNNSKGWSIRLSRLHSKTGSKSNNRGFKRSMIKSATANNESNYMPDYNFSVEEDNPNPLITVEPKPAMPKKSKSNNQQSQNLNFKPETINGSCVYKQFDGFDVQSDLFGHQLPPLKLVKKILVQDQKFIKND